MLVGKDDTAELARIFRALGDPVRLRMMSLIASRPEICVCDITPAFELSSGTISHHLKGLREAGLVDCERRGTYVYYWLQPDVVERVAAVLGTIRTPSQRKPISRSARP